MCDPGHKSSLHTELISNTVQTKRVSRNVSQADLPSTPYIHDKQIIVTKHQDEQTKPSKARERKVVV